MPWWLLVLLVLLAVIAAGGIIYRLAWRGVNHARPVEVWRGGRWEAYTALLYYDHWLPRLLRCGGVTIGRRIWLKHGPSSEAREGRPAVPRILPAHEFAHFFRWMIRPDLELFVFGFLWGIVAHVRNKRKQREEAFAYKHEQAISDGSSILVQFPGDWLRKEFPV